MTAAALTSPAAYLGSLAAVADVPAPSAYRQPDLLPESVPLHAWIADSMHTVLEQCPEAAQHLPDTTTSFNHHFATAAPSVAPSLQRTISTQAKPFTKTSRSTARGMERIDGRRTLAHALVISAPRACAWKTVVPATQELHLADNFYQLAARLNLGLPPLTEGSQPPMRVRAARRTSH